MSDDERPKEEEPRTADENVSEAKLRMEQELKKRQEKAQEEWAEYEEIRKVQREKEQEDIQELRERREKRKKEREEEEKRLAVLRAQEEQKRRAEEEERQRRKREDENKKKEARDRKRLEAEQRTKNIGKPNFTIGKRSDTDAAQDEEPKEQKVQKTKEQLEAERKAALEQRYHQLNTAGFNIEQFRQKAKDLHQLIYKLESEKYDLKKRFEQQNYDMMELQEKARQMNKGGSKNAKVNVAQTPDPLASKMSGVPPKITMYSQYERVKDHRPFVERRDVFSGPLYSDEYQRVEPEHKVIMTEQGARYVDGAEDSHHGGHSKENEEPVQNGV